MYCCLSLKLIHSKVNYELFSERLMGLIKHKQLDSKEFVHAYFHRPVYISCIKLFGTDWNISKTIHPTDDIDYETFLL